MIVVFTHRRPGGVDYLAATLAAVDASATGRRWVVTDSNDYFPEVPRPWRVYSFDRPNTERPENRWAMWRAFQLAHEHGEDLIVFEDDVELCVHAAAYAEQLVVPADVAWVSLYDPWFDERAPHGLWKSTASGFMFSQGIKFPLRTCELLRHVPVGVYPRCGSDEQLAIWGRLLGLHYAVHVPSLVQHVGDVSAVGNGDTHGRTSRSFKRERDAFKLSVQRGAA